MTAFELYTRACSARGATDGLRSPAATTASSRPRPHTSTRLPRSSSWRTSRSSPRPGIPPTATRPGDPEALITHAERRRAYRIAVLDTPPDRAVSRGARRRAAAIDSTYAALYYPWVIVANPLARPGHDQHPARDRAAARRASSAASTRATTSSAASSRRPPTRSCAARSASSRDINFAPAGGAQPARRELPALSSRAAATGCGARAPPAPIPSGSTSTCAATSTTSKRSIDAARSGRCSSPTARRCGPTSARPSRASSTTSGVSGALLGATPEEAFFVRCDRSTMTQNDLDNGRLICLDRRRGAEAGRVRHLPHRPEDRRRPKLS